MYSHIRDWNVSKVTDMKSLFRGMTTFNADLSKWNVGRVQQMDFMFYDAMKFNSDLSHWDVSAVTSIEGMNIPKSIPIQRQYINVEHQLRGMPVDKQLDFWR